MAGEDNQTKEESSKMSDVAKPGETPASATSRPVIVKHRAIMNDPMVAPANPSQLAESETPQNKTDANDTDELVSRKAANVKPPEANSEPAVETKVDTQTDDKADNTNEPDSPSLGTAAVDALANQAVKKKNESKEDREKIDLINKHIEEKTYFAPIGQTSKRRAKIHGAVVIVLLLLLVGVYVAIDANFILKDVSLPVELIK